MMNSAPKSVRLHIGICGRANVGKSSFLNYIAGQDVAITSPLAGTTTDVVAKAMELPPLGPVLFLDTAGIDDVSELAGQRARKTRSVFSQADVICLVVEPDIWSAHEEDIVQAAAGQRIPVVAVVNKADIARPRPDFLRQLAEKTRGCVVASSVAPEQRQRVLAELKALIGDVCPPGALSPPHILGDLITAGDSVVLIVPIDLQAPKGRLILPQVQAIRDALDVDAMVMVVKEREYSRALQRLTVPPALVVCDSQVVMKMIADTPDEIACTTFSILFSRYKGDLLECVRGAQAIDRLRPGDRVLIAESCTHHALADDIGRVKIPRWLRQYLGFSPAVDVCAGSDYPSDLERYRLIIQCGGCMMNRREILSRISAAKAQGVAITNYGVCIAKVQGVLPRVLSPFAAARELAGALCPQREAG